MFLCHGRSKWKVLRAFAGGAIHFTILPLQEGHVGNFARKFHLPGKDSAIWPPLLPGRGSREPPEIPGIYCGWSVRNVGGPEWGEGKVNHWVQIMPNLECHLGQPRLYSGDEGGH